MRASFCLLFLFFLVLPAHAGEPRIIETDTEIVVEINGSEEDRLASQKQAEERAQAAAKELEAQRRREALAQRKLLREKNRDNTE